jgi:hypothetical protein
MPAFLTGTAFKLGGKALKAGFNLLKNRQNKTASKTGEPKVPLGERLKSGYQWAKGQFDKVATFKKTESGGISIEPKSKEQTTKAASSGEMNWTPILIGAGALLLLTSMK